MISSGATMVTFLLLAGMVPGSRNCLQVIDEIQEMRSPSSVSGLRLSFTIRLPDGNFLQELNSFSPITAAPEAVPAGAGVAARRRAAAWRRAAARGGAGRGRSASAPRPPGGTLTALLIAPFDDGGARHESTPTSNSPAPTISAIAPLRRTAPLDGTRSAVADRSHFGFHRML